MYHIVVIFNILSIDSLETFKYKQTQTQNITDYLPLLRSTLLYYL